MKKFNSKKFFIFIISTSIMFFCIWLFSVDFYSNTLKKQYLSEMREKFKTEVSKVEISTRTAMGFVSSLNGFVLSNMSRELSQNEFEIYATEAMKEQYVKNFSLAPENIQKFVYPIKGNEVTVDHNLNSDTRDAVRRDVQRAQITGSIVISGPYQLRQGGLGMVVRSPIYYDKNYWGLVNVVIDIDKILLDSNFTNLKDIIGIAITDGEGNIFYGLPSASENYDFQYNISIGNEYWQVFGKLIKEENPFDSLKIKFFSIIFFISIILFEILFLSIIYKNFLLSDDVNRMIYTDILTNLPNRRALKNEIDEYTNKQIPFAIIFLDIDNFKNINESYGHIIGDNVLFEISRRLVEITSPAIKIFRWGGDEFIILILRKYEKFILDVIDKINTTFTEPIILENNSFALSFSGGVSLFPEHGESSSEIIKNSDIALQYSKEHGKRHIAYFSREIKKNTKEKLDLERKLEDAISKNKLEVFFQPQVDYKNNRVFGIEALVRWFDEDGNSISPSIFIPIAERIGLIRTIDSYVLNQSLEFLKTLNNSGHKLKLSVNFSNYTFTDDMFNYLKKKQENGDLNCCDLEIEITESIAIESYFSTNNLIKKFKDIGITVALDDFGTGYSSLSYLTKLNVSTIKIDRMFIKEIKNKTIEKSIIKALIAISEDTGIRIIAEGVETKTELSELINMNCNLYQGYYFSKPLSKNETIEFIKNYSNNNYPN